MLETLDSISWNELEHAYGEASMTVADLSELQRDVLTAIYETEKIWTFGDLAFIVGNILNHLTKCAAYSWEGNG